MKIAIAVDDWKLPVFRKNLTEAGISYTDGDALVANVTFLKVETNDMLRLQGLLSRCEAECKEAGKPA